MGYDDASVLDRSVLVVLPSLAARLLKAEPTSADSTTAADQLKALRDQTIIQPRVVLSAPMEKQLDGSAKKFEVNFTMTYYFEK